MKNVLIFNKFLVTMIHTSTAHPGGGGGLLRISRDRDDQMEAKLKPPKIPGPKFNPPKIPMQNFRAIKISRGTTLPGYAGIITNLQTVYNTQKNPFLNQATRKTLAEIFLTKIENFKPQKILRSSLSLEIRSFPRPWAAYNHWSLLRSSYSLVTQRSTFVWEKRCVTRQPHNHQFTSFL